MRCYLRPQEIQGISFDLDDTLYDNQPYIARAEAELIRWLHRDFPRSLPWQTQDWRALKQELLQQTPHLAHDTSAARLATLEYGLARLGYSTTKAQQGAQAGLACFGFYRSDFQVSSEVIALLSRLQQRFRLIGITNGNVDHQRIGLGAVLEFTLHPGQGVQMKPARDMFALACDRLGVPLGQLLHVGDSLHADVC
ncbi:MAG: HAD-IA family hydrolase, partial [Shewanella sp.]